VGISEVRHRKSQEGYLHKPHGSAFEFRGPVPVSMYKPDARCAREGHKPLYTSVSLFKKPLKKSGYGNSGLRQSSLVNTLPITKKNKYTLVTEAHKECTFAAYAPANY